MPPNKQMLITTTSIYFSRIWHMGSYGYLWLCCWLWVMVGVCSMCIFFPCVFLTEGAIMRNACSAAAAGAKSLQSCPTLCDPIDGSPPGSPVPGILQARPPEWVATSFSNAWKWKVKVKSLSHVWLFTSPWTAAYQAPPSMGFSRQEYWSGVPLPSPNARSSGRQKRRIHTMQTILKMSHPFTLLWLKVSYMAWFLPSILPFPVCAVSHIKN